MGGCVSSSWLPGARAHAARPTLRPYQETAIEGLRAHHRERPILMLPTGAGKTVVACALIHGAIERGGRVVFLVHRRELLKQARDRLADWGIEAGVVAAGWPSSPGPVQVASIATLARRDARPRASVVIVDECQHARAASWERTLEGYERDGACIIGLSATPYRLDGRGLGPMFGAIVAPVTVRELCDQGVLIDPRVLAPPPPDLDGVHRRGGDYVSSELHERYKGLEGDIIDHWRRHANGRRTVMFAVNIQHSIDLVARMVEAGIPAEHLDGSSPPEHRDAVLDRLRLGETLVVSNCMVLGEGWDLPALECAIIARPTASMALHRQMIGRIMRSCDDKDGALVLDHAGNTIRLGLVTDEVEVSLDGKAKRVADHPIRTCPACYCVCPIACSSCPECGHDFEVTEKERRGAPEETDGRLVDVKDMREHRAVFYAQLVTRAAQYGNRVGWARYKFKDQHGDWPSARTQLGRRAYEVERRHYVCRGYEPRVVARGRKTTCGRCWRDASEHETGRVALAW